MPTKKSDDWDDGPQGSAPDLPVVPGTDWANLSFSELMAGAGDQLVTIESASVIDKAQLVNVPFIIVSWKWNTGKQGPETMASMVITLSRPVDTETGPVDRGVINDGSTGIAEQLRKLEAKGITGLVAVPKGLRMSTYDHPEHGPSKTFYLS